MIATVLIAILKRTKGDTFGILSIKKITKLMHNFFYLWTCPMKWSDICTDKPQSAQLFGKLMKIYIPAQILLYFLAMWWAFGLLTVVFEQSNLHTSEPNQKIFQNLCISRFLFSSFRRIFLHHWNLSLLLLIIYKIQIIRNEFDRSCSHLVDSFAVSCLASTWTDLSAFRKT